MYHMAPTTSTNTFFFFVYVFLVMRSIIFCNPWKILEILVEVIFVVIFSNFFIETHVEGSGQQSIRTSRGSKANDDFIQKNIWIQFGKKFGIVKDWERIPIQIKGCIFSQFENELVPSWERGIWEKHWELVPSRERACSQLVPSLTTNTASRRFWSWNFKLSLINIVHVLNSQIYLFYVAS